MPPTLVCQDVIHWAETTPPIGAHALLTDCPYELSFMNSRWDASGISFRPETWAALARHLLPGAFVMAFASSRGWHRLACAMEDAGLRIQPSIFAWANGQAFPKATRIEADGWDGHRYGGQMLKNAIEPIIVAQVPYQGRPVSSIVTYGAGALNIEGGRLPTAQPLGRLNHTTSLYVDSANGTREPHERHIYVDNSAGAGRWPANLALCHLPTCQLLGVQRVRNGSGPPGIRTPSIYEPRGGLYTPGRSGGTQHYASPDGTETVPTYHCTPGCPVAALDAQAGERKAGGPKDCRGQQHGYKSARFSTRNQTYDSYADDGPASRFFYTADWSLDVAEQLAHADLVHYCAKASSAERHAGTGGRNTHPCIKPLSLCKWLATLLLPPSAYAPRRLLVPFSGTASEMIGAVLAGWETVVGIEHDETFVEVGRKRIAWWTGYTVPSTAPREPAPQTLTRTTGPGQLNLFGRT